MTDENTCTINPKTGRAAKKGSRLYNKIMGITKPRRKKVKEKTYNEMTTAEKRTYNLAKARAAKAAKKK